MQGELLRSIAAVSAAWRSATEAAAIRAAAPTEALIGSVAAVANAVRNREQSIPPPPKLTAHDFLASVYAITRALKSQLADAVSPVAYGHSVQQIIGRQFDENFHSDVIASLLSSPCVGRMAHEFLAALLSTVTGRPVTLAPRHQLATREVRLDDIRPSLIGREAGARRIDILLSRPELVLVIENKVWTTESEHQTRDYATAIAERFGNRPAYLLFLSPSGMRPNDPAFRPMSYLTLHAVLRQLQRSAGFDEVAHHVLDDYLSCVAHSFVEPRLGPVRRSIAILEENGHDFD